MKFVGPRDDAVAGRGTVGGSQNSRSGPDKRRFHSQSHTRTRCIATLKESSDVPRDVSTVEGSHVSGVDRVQHIADREDSRSART